uniref:Uncharacterized protein n=1 Tax=Oreochromis aureus TaxID=47969 RepID=A0A668UFL5_OREAU
SREDYIRSSPIRRLFLGRVTEFTHCLTACFPTVVPLEEKQFLMLSCVQNALKFRLTEQRNIFKKRCVERWHKAKCMTSITLNDKVITVSGVYALMTLRRNNRHLSSTDTEDLTELISRLICFAVVFLNGILFVSCSKVWISSYSTPNEKPKR